MRARLARGWIGVFTLGHFALSMGLFLLAFNYTMDLFDSGTPKTWWMELLEVTVGVLFFPIVSVVLEFLPPGQPAELAGYVVFVANSLLWGVALWWLGSWWRSRRV